ncbi:DUF421 domain-containing protein [Ammoniphilus sp. CFH 90114]|uniref:DUF421 domain-containing protein n=1 Tax=Ammoniphilus sp. CFH 90114 TaxID=2493665 RepID=UPI00100E7333|nr:DUF421 domain-containing protein [Ammoniphilus sp. CFH 90114]RXT05251.1 DUF421 domain-containing protein [Ammoniphilus sp. CFH 90114]
MEFVKDLLIVAGRIFTILPLLLIVTLIMGKRSIGELPVFDFLIILAMGAVVGADIADPSIHHLPTIGAIIFIAVLQRLVSNWAIRSRRFGRLITFEPTIVIHEGQFLNSNIRGIRYSIDNILQMLRERDIFDVSDVHLGIIESNGKLTVQKKPNKETVTIEDMGIKKRIANMTYPVIVEGKIYGDVLKAMNLNESWLKDELHRRGIRDVDKVFFASINEKHEVHLSLANPEVAVSPPIHH